MLVLRIGRYRQFPGGAFFHRIDPRAHAQEPAIPGRDLPRCGQTGAKTVDETGQLRFWGHDQLGADKAVVRGRALMLSNEELKRMETIINGHMRIHFFTNRLIEEGKPPTRRAIYRFFRQNGPAGVDICLLTLADLRATYEQTLPQETWIACLEVVRLLLEAWFEKQEETVSPTALVDGNDLQRELSLQPGPLIGKLIESIREAQAAGELSTREEALALAREKLEEKK